MKSETQELKAEMETLKNQVKELKGLNILTRDLAGAAKSIGDSQCYSGHIFSGKQYTIKVYDKKSRHERISKFFKDNFTKEEVSQMGSDAIVALASKM